MAMVTHNDFIQPTMQYIWKEKRLAIATTKVTHIAGALGMEANSKQWDKNSLVYLAWKLGNWSYS